MGQKGGLRDSEHGIGANPRPAEVKRMRLYKVKGHTDTTEGRGPLYTVGYFTDPDLAERASKDKGVMGSDGIVEPVVATVAAFQADNGEVMHGIIKEFVQVEYEDPADVRKRALDKLTPKERKALGL